MKKIKTVLLAFFVGSILSCASSTASISEELIIAPDPENPFQGTWVSMGYKNYMHVINGMNGEWFSFNPGYYGIGRGWVKQAVYAIEEKDDGFTTSNNWRISVNGNILTVESMTYERFVK
ncbi:MAG: hypothetical protein FWF55_07675 [Treponema sp.]|nr:hypothetical protein [Treponema sp.]